MKEGVITQTFVGNCARSERQNKRIATPLTRTTTGFLDMANFGL